MSKKNSENKNKEPDFLYDYGKTTIYKKQYAKNVKSDGFIKMPFKSSDNTANPSLIISSSNTKCETTNLYIYGNVHGIKEATETYDGELIIEHEPITNSYEKLYVCLLLKTDNGVKKTNVLDKIINDTMETSEVLNLNELIPEKSEYIMNKTSNVIIFTKPIHIMSSFEKFKKIGDPSEKLFDYSEKNFAKSVGEKGTSNYEGFLGMKIIEGNQNQYMECVPDDGTPSDTTILTTTIDSNFAKISQNNSSLYSALNMVTLIIVILFSGILIPPAYKYIIVNAIDSWGSNSGEDKVKNLKTVDTLLIVWGLIVVVSSITGFSLSEYSSGTMFGVVFLILFILSIIILVAFKYINPPTYSLIDSNYKYDSKKSGIAFISEVLSALKNNLGSTIGLFAFVIIIPIVILNPLAYKTTVFGKAGSENSYKIANTIQSLVHLFAIPLVPAFVYNYSNKSTSSNP